MSFRHNAQCLQLADTVASSDYTRLSKQIAAAALFRSSINQHLRDFRPRRFAVAPLPKQSDRLADLRDILLAQPALRDGRVIAGVDGGIGAPRRPQPQRRSRDQIRSASVGRADTICEFEGAHAIQLAQMMARRRRQHVDTAVIQARAAIALKAPAEPGSLCNFNGLMAAWLGREDSNLRAP
jgi:hypothetical protein